MKKNFIWQAVLVCLCIFTVLTVLTFRSSKKQNLLLELIQPTVSQRPVQFLNKNVFESNKNGMYMEEYKFDFPDPSPSVVKRKHLRKKRDASGIIDAKKISAHNIKTDKMYAKNVNADIVKAEKVKAIVISIGRAFSVMKATRPTGSPDTLVLNRNGPDPTDTAVTIVLEREGKPVSINGHPTHESEKHKLLNIKNKFVEKQQSKNTKSTRGSSKRKSKHGTSRRQNRTRQSTRQGTVLRTGQSKKSRPRTDTKVKMSKAMRSGANNRGQQSQHTRSGLNVKARYSKNTTSRTVVRARTKKQDTLKRSNNRTIRLSPTIKSNGGNKRKEITRKDSFVRTRPASPVNTLKTKSEHFQKLKGQPQSSNVFPKPLVLRKQSSKTNVFVKTARRDLTRAQKKRLILMHWKKKMKAYQRRKALFDKGLNYPYMASHAAPKGLHNMQKAPIGKNRSNLIRRPVTTPGENILMHKIKTNPKHSNNNSLKATIQVPFQVSSSKLLKQTVQIPSEATLNPNYLRKTKVTVSSTKGMHAPSPSPIPRPRVYPKSQHRFLVLSKNTSPYLHPVLSKIQKDLDKESSMAISSDESIDSFEYEFESQESDDLPKTKVSLNAFVKRKPHFFNDNSDTYNDKTSISGLFDLYDNSDETYEWQNSEEDKVGDDKHSVLPNKRTRNNKPLPAPKQSESKTRSRSNVESKNDISDESFEYYSDEYYSDSNEDLTLLGGITNSIKNPIPLTRTIGFKKERRKVEIMADYGSNSDYYSYEYASDDSDRHTRNKTRKELKNKSVKRKYRNMHNIHSDSDYSSETDSNSQKQFEKDTVKKRENFFTESAEDWFYDSEPKFSEFYSSADKTDSTFVFREKIT